MSEPANPVRHNHEILLPFENGQVARISLALYKAPKGQHRPVDAYVVTECEGNFTQSARRAAEAVFSLAVTHVTGTGPVVAGFDVRDTSSDMDPVTGESGGLAFALALAGHLFKHDPGPLAATGVVKGSGGGGPVGRVSGITAKISAAVEHLPENARILYPAENHLEIPEALATRARRKGQALCPVSSVVEAIRVVFPENLISGDPDDRSSDPTTASRKTRLILLAAGTLLTIAAIILAVWSGIGPQMNTTPAGVPTEPKTTISPQSEVAAKEDGLMVNEAANTATQTEEKKSAEPFSIIDKIITDGKNEAQLLDNNSDPETSDVNVQLMKTDKGFD